MCKQLFILTGKCSVLGKTVRKYFLHKKSKMLPGKFFAKKIKEIYTKRKLLCLGNSQDDLLNMKSTLHIEKSNLQS